MIMVISLESGDFIPVQRLIRSAEMGKRLQD